MNEDQAEAKWYHPTSYRRVRQGTLIDMTLSRPLGTIGGGVRRE